MASSDYEEQWSPLRIFLGAAIVLTIGLAIYAGFWYSGIKVEVRNSVSLCQTATPLHANYLRALNTGDSTLCATSYNPAQCQAVIQKDITLCPSSSPEHDECMFAITHDQQYCDNEASWCQAMSMGQSVLCDQGPSYLRTSCIADVTKNPDLLLSAMDADCADFGWENTAYTYQNALLCRFIKDSERQDDCINDIKNNLY